MNVLIAGDFCPQYRVADLFDKGDFASVLGDIQGVIQSVDYSIVNFECSVSKGEEEAIVKAGTNLQYSEKGVWALKWTGFDCVTLANNHFYDYGEKGVLNTINACRKYGIDIVGGGTNIDVASQILYKVIDGMTLAIINCCEHEFSIASDNKGGSNPLNPIRQYYDILEAKENADYVLVIVHGGPEHFPLPSARMQEIYRFFVDVGADVVVNHHQHCFSGYESYKNKPIFYGIGNFCFDNKLNRSPLWYDGLLVELEMNKGEEVRYKFIPINQCGETPSVNVLHCSSFSDRISKLNEIINSPEKLRQEVELYYDSWENIYYTDIFEPIANRFYLAFKHRGWFPSLIGRNRKIMAYNHIWCEAHRDKLLYKLKKIYDNIKK